MRTAPILLLRVQCSFVLIGRIRQMNELQEKLKGLQELNRQRFDYVLARATGVTIEKAAIKANRTRKWYYSFPKKERDELEMMANELHYDRITQAILILEDHAAIAAGVKVDGMDSEDERIRQGASSDILDRLGVKSVEKSQVEHSVREETLRSLDDMLEKIYGNRDDDTEPTA